MPSAVSQNPLVNGQEQNSSSRRYTTAWSTWLGALGAAYFMAVGGTAAGSGASRLPSAREMNPFGGVVEQVALLKLGETRRGIERVLPPHEHAAGRVPDVAPPGH